MIYQKGVKKNKTFPFLTWFTSVNIAMPRWAANDKRWESPRKQPNITKLLTG